MLSSRSKYIPLLTYCKYIPATQKGTKGQSRRSRHKTSRSLLCDANVNSKRKSSMRNYALLTMKQLPEFLGLSLKVKSAAAHNTGQRGGSGFGRAGNKCSVHESRLAAAELWDCCTITTFQCKFLELCREIHVIFLLGDGRDFKICSNLKANSYDDERKWDLRFRITLQN